MGRKLGALPPSWGGGLGPHLSQCRLHGGLSGILIHQTIWPQQIWAENWGGGCVPLGEGDLDPHLTQCGQDRGLPVCQVSS